jgi:hypothetical protein
MSLLDSYPYGFVPPGPTNTKLDFLPFTDSEERFNNNLKTQPLEWIYRSLPITYDYNSLGFRCKNHSELNDNYILFSGCSHTEGVGLPLETTYPYLVSKEMNMDYYNLAVGGSGPDILFKNMVLFLSLIKHKPKVVIIQWPDQSRIGFVSGTTDRFNYFNSSCSSSVYKELIRENLVEKTNEFYRLLLVNFLYNLNITNILEMGNNNFFNLNLGYKTRTSTFHLNKNTTKARDLAHFGIEAHTIKSEEILTIIKTM